MLEKVSMFLLGLVASGFGVFFAMNGRLTALETQAQDQSDPLSAAQVGEIVDNRLEAIATVPIAVASNAVVQNDSPRPLIVVGYCNGTGDAKNIEAKIGEGAADLLVATESGTQRGSLTFVVPPRWYYAVAWDSVKGVGCRFQGWRI